VKRDQRERSAAAKAPDEAGGDARIENGWIVIRVAIATLPGAWKSAVELGFVEPGWKIIDANVFAHDVVLALNEGDDDGTTPVHRLFDAACEEAIAQGSQGVTEDPIEESEE
jgi:hypothetical protein